MDKLKVKFFSLHLVISLIVVIGISFLCQFFWFPSPFLLLDGTWIALLILAGIDIIIGPFLTLLLVSSKKSTGELIFDMSIILMFQLSALSYGLSQIYSERLFALIYMDGAFNPVPMKEIDPIYRDNELSLPKYKGIYFGVVKQGEKSLSNNVPLLYSPLNYDLLSKTNMNQQGFTYSKLPLSIKRKYSNNYIFKVLPGKKGVAVVIITNEMSIIDIVYLDNSEN